MEQLYQLVYDNFIEEIDAIDNGTPLIAEWLEAVAAEDGLFPLLNAADWVSMD